MRTSWVPVHGISESRAGSSTAPGSPADLGSQQPPVCLLLPTGQKLRLAAGNPEVFPVA